MKFSYIPWKIDSKVCRSVCIQSTKKKKNLTFIIIIFLKTWVLWSCGYFVVLTTEAETVRMNGTEQESIMEAINR